MKRILVALALSLGLLAVTAGTAAWYVWNIWLDEPPESFPAGVRIDVNKGESFGETAGKLEERGLVPSAPALRVWARLTGDDRKIQHGAYRFEKPVAPTTVLEKMRNGESMMLRVTVPEGLTIEDVAHILAEAGLGEEERFLELARDPQFARELAVPADTLEGYLFPETYYFSPLAGERRILKAMVRRFRSVFDGERERAAREAGLTPHEVVILASIVEKETGATEERPLIAAVFRNRLDGGIPLQADPTVIYGIDDFDGNITREHLETPTPYNTYTNSGLPAGPIANPGAEAIEAVLDPAEVPYLYFVSRNDGSHEFSETLAEHERAVDRYQHPRRGRSSE